MKKGLVTLNRKQISDKNSHQQSILKSINSSTTWAYISTAFLRQKLINNRSLQQHSLLNRKLITINSKQQWMTQDWFISVLNKVSYIPVDNFTINIELFRQTLCVSNFFAINTFLTSNFLDDRAGMTENDTTFQYFSTAPNFLTLWSPRGCSVKSVREATYTSRFHNEILI